MKNWPVQDAKARFSEMLNACLSEGPQVVTRRGEKTAVLVPVEEWEKMTRSERPSLKDVLFSGMGKGELQLPPRGNAKSRPPIIFD